MVENRFVGMKSRGVYEAPGMTLLYAAHRLVEQLTLDRDLVHLRDRLAPEVAEMVYYGFWYHAKLDALLAFIRQAQKPANGEVSLNLYKGNIFVAGRSSPNNLYDEGIATMEGGGSYNQTDAEASSHPGVAQPRAGPRVAARVLKEAGRGILAAIWPLLTLARYRARIIVVLSGLVDCVGPDERAISSVG